MKLLHFSYRLLQYVFLIICLPITLCLFIIEYIRFRKYTNICIHVVNGNQDFFEYLSKLEFHPDWLKRLYSVQPIPKEFQDFTDDELYDITMRSLLPMVKLIERNVLVDVVGITINRIDQDAYIICLTPHNWNRLKTWFKLTAISLCIWIGFFICNVFFHWI